MKVIVRKPLTPICKSTCTSNSHLSLIHASISRFASQESINLHIKACPYMNYKCSKILFDLTSNLGFWMTFITQMSNLLFFHVALTVGASFRPPCDEFPWEEWVMRCCCCHLLPKLNISLDYIVVRGEHVTAVVDETISWWETI